MMRRHNKKVSPNLRKEKARLGRNAAKAGKRAHGVEAATHFLTPQMSESWR